MKNKLSRAAVLIGTALAAAGWPFASEAFTPGEYTDNANTLALYHMNQSSGTTVTDDNTTGRTAHNGTINPPPSPTWTTNGHFGNGLNFADANVHGVWVFDNAVSLLGTNSFAVEFYMKRDAVNTQAHPMNIPAYFFVQFGVGGDDLVRVGINTSTGFKVAAVTLNFPDDWNHIRVTVFSSGGTTTISLYVNGFLESTASGGTLNPAIGDQPLFFGSRNATSDGGAFVGTIDEFRVFSPGQYIDDALTLALYHMNQSSGTTVTDDNTTGRTAHNGTINPPPSPTWTTNGYFGNGLNFADANVHGVRVFTNAVSLLGTNFTVELYMKRDAVNTQAHPWNIPAYFFLQTGVGGDDLVRAGINTSTGFKVAAATVDQANWNDVAVTVDSSGGTTTISLYVNGFLESTASGGTLNPAAGDQPLFFGSRNDTSDGGAFVGTMDEFRVSFSTPRIGIKLILTNLSVTSLAGVGTKIQFRVLGPTGQTGIIQAATDLGAWTPVITNTFVNGFFEFAKTNSVSLNRQFYRAMLP